jgi:TPP-dependent pyruvate/acetoin dehydrogenase alpha subunit
MLFLIIISCIAMVGMLGFSVYAHEQSYRVPVIEQDHWDDRIADLKWRIYRQQMLSDKEKIARQEKIQKAIDEAKNPKQDIQKQNEMSDLRAKLMPKN